MITIYLIWTLFGGAPQDVDAFINREQCEQAHEQITEMLDMARTQRPELKDLSISVCIPVQVKEPK